MDIWFEELVAQSQPRIERRMLELAAEGQQIVQRYWAVIEEIRTDHGARTQHDPKYRRSLPLKLMPAVRVPKASSRHVAARFVWLRSDRSTYGKRTPGARTTTLTPRSASGFAWSELQPFAHPIFRIPIMAVEQAFTELRAEASTLIDVRDLLRSVARAAEPTRTRAIQRAVRGVVVPKPVINPDV